MTMLVLVATVAGERIAIEASRVESVVDLWQVVGVPLSPVHVIGVAAVRTRVLTVIDAAAAIGLRAKATGNRAIVIEAGGHRYALRVDSIADVVMTAGDAGQFDANLNDRWINVSKGTVDTEFGFAILVDPVSFVDGMLVAAA